MIVEAEAHADSVERDAQNTQQTELIRIDAAIRTQRAQTDCKVTDARTQQVALIAEAQGQIAAAVVQATAELEVQRARVEQVRSQLEADEIAPAQAWKEAAISRARGDAAKIIEEGRATTEVLSMITQAWRKAGPDARDVFLMQKLDTMVTTLMRTLESVEIDKITVLGTGAGRPGGGAGDGLAAGLIGANEQLRAAFGVDVIAAMQARLGARSAGPQSAGPLPSATAASPPEPEPTNPPGRTR